MTFIRFVPFPNNKVRAFTLEDCNGDYNVYINSNLSMEMQRLAYEHECEHIKNGDLDITGDIQDIELKRHCC